MVAWRNCNAEDHRWDDRQKCLKSAVENATKGTWQLLQQFIGQQSNQLLLQGKPALVATLTLLGDLASIVQDESTTSKVVLYSALSVWIEPTLSLLRLDSSVINDHGKICQVSQSVRIWCFLILLNLYC